MAHTPVIDTILEHYSTNHRISCKDRPWWVTGFTDGDGGFSVTPQKTTSHLGHKVNLEYKVSQKDTSIDVLYAIQDYFGCGSVVIDNRKDNTYKFHVTSLKDILDKVIPHFESYALVTSKKLNFLDFKLVANMKRQGSHLTTEGIEAILSIKAKMNKNRSFDEKWNFMSNNKPISLHRDWVAGFIDREGTFHIELAQRAGNTRTNTYTACYGELSVAQNSHDILVLDAIKEFFNNKGAKASLKPKYDIISLREAKSMRSVSRVKIRQEQFVIDLLDKHPLLTQKKLDFQDYKEVMSLYRSKAHLTKEGFSKMMRLKRGMNTGRNK